MWKRFLAISFQKKILSTYSVYQAAKDPWNGALVTTSLSHRQHRRKCDSGVCARMLQAFAHKLALQPFKASRPTTYISKCASKSPGMLGPPWTTSMGSRPARFVRYSHPGLPAWTKFEHNRRIRENTKNSSLYFFAKIQPQKPNNKQLPAHMSKIIACHVVDDTCSPSCQGCNSTSAFSSPLFKF